MENDYAAWRWRWWMSANAMVNDGVEAVPNFVHIWYDTICKLKGELYYRWPVLWRSGVDSYTMWKLAAFPSHINYVWNIWNLCVDCFILNCWYSLKLLLATMFKDMNEHIYNYLSLQLVFFLLTARWHAKNKLVSKIWNAGVKYLMTPRNTSFFIFDTHHPAHCERAALSGPSIEQSVARSKRCDKFTFVTRNKSNTPGRLIYLPFRITTTSREYVARFRPNLGTLDITTTEWRRRCWGSDH